MNQQIAGNRAWVAREGWPWVAASAAGGGLCLYAGLLWPAAVLALVFLVLLALFFDPARRVPPFPLAVIAPVDGRITEISGHADDVLTGRWLRLTIQIYWHGAYTCRAPIEGSICNLSSIVTPDHEPRGLWVKSEEDDDVVLLFPVRGPARTPKAFCSIGERVGQGERFAYLRLAPVAHLYVPASLELAVSPGDVVRAGTSVIGELRH